MDGDGLVADIRDETPTPTVSNFGQGPIPGGLLNSQGRFITSNKTEKCIHQTWEICLEFTNQEKIDQAWFQGALQAVLEML